MYSISIGLILLASLFYVIFTGIGSVKASRLLYSRSIERLNQRIRKLLFWSWFPIIPAAAGIGAIAWMRQTMEPVFWLDRALIQAPLIVVPVLSIWLLAVPKLFKLRSITKQIKKEQDEQGETAQLESAIYQRAASPALILPFQMTALGALTALYFVLVPPLPFQWLEISIPLAVFVLATFSLWWRHHIRFKQVGKTANYVIPPFWKRAAAPLGMTAVIAGLGYYLFTTALNNSALPAQIDMASGTADYGGQIRTAVTSLYQQQNSVEIISSSPSNAVSNADLTRPLEGTPDRRFTLTAEKKTITLSSGKTVDAWTYNGQIPGPELRVKEGELVEITLTNQDIEQGVTVHSHGLDVPNAEAGAPDASQLAAMPGETRTFRFRAEQTGTSWYYSLPNSQEAVSMGLFGAFIVEPKDTPLQEISDITVMTHRWKGGGMSIGASDQVERMTIAPGTSVRMRLIHTDDWVQQRFTLVGTHFEVAAIDGTELNKPDILTNTHLIAASGGRYDLTFIMPEHPVYLNVDGKSKLGILMSPDGKGAVPEIPQTVAFDPLHYGSPRAAAIDASSRFDRNFTMILDNKLGFYNRTMDFLATVNGHLYPDSPMLTLKEGDLVKTTLINRGYVDYPIHLHGHHALVLSRNGKPSTGSPWWADTLAVQPGETYEVAFVADNSSLWMNPDHNLVRTAAGIITRLRYEGVIAAMKTRFS